ncbi:hypothetical protein FBEOM_1509 [Fusarium beomiforme]|uniref:Protein kinase domain-containing protein n=1 Tax=Fusarium beomiforme TaxID=44412 RepID=A0A9P5AT73_9HYPO|nr:hypothetical protein FBEOM_1509 [Fusarium beomiforme]
MGDTAETEATDDVAVSELYGGDGDGATMVFTFNGSLVSVSISPSNGSSTKATQGQEDRPLQDHLIDAISKATTCQDDDEYEELVDEVFLAILKAGRPLFSQAISSQEAPDQNSRSLHRLLFPPVFYYRLKAPDSSNCVSIIPISPGEANVSLTIGAARDQGLETLEEELEIRQDLPRYTPEEVTVTDIFVSGGRAITATVQVQGRDMFCKARGDPGGLLGTSEGRELECLGTILQPFSQSAGMRIPRLLGYVHHKDTKQILGFLRQWVPGRRLSEITSAPAEKREKWASRIRETIDSLHKNGLVWGDAKPGNIIIDDQDDAWLIDFGGGYTHGWVDEQLVETKEGDEEALTRILDYLNQGDFVSLSSED